MIDNNIIIGRTLCDENYELIRRSALTTINAYLKHQKVSLSSSDKERILSDVFAKVLTKGYTFDPKKSNLKTWVSTIARNETVNFFRNQTEWEPLERENADGELYEREELTSYTTPLDELEASETELLFERVMSKRSDMDQEIMKLYRQGYQPKEIAQTFNMSADAVSVRIFKIRAAFREAIALAG